MAAATEKPIPAPTHETRPYWEGCKAHELRIQRCGECGARQVDGARLALVHGQGGIMSTHCTMILGSEPV